jgi:hydrogenase nickel incorporation protein HypA/HybF
MHEIAIARDLAKLICDQQQVEEFTRVKRARVQIGVMSGIDANALRSTFELVVMETCAEGCSLEIESVPLFGRCRHCGAECQVKQWSFTCESCGETDVELLHGDEIILSEIEIETPEEELCRA